MSSINGYDSVSTLFSNLGGTTTDSTSNGLYGINLADYASIKNGSYSKLMKAYYAQDDTESSKTNSKNDTDDSDKTIAEIKSTTDSLKESAQALYGSKSLFEKDENGEYDMEAIYDKVNAFIEDYNSVIESVGSAETESIAKAGANMVNAVTNNADMLSKIGIKINESDYTLSIDKDQFMESRITDLKSVFSGVGSFAYQIGAKASRIYTMVEDKVSSGGYYKSGVESSTSSSTSKDTANTIAKIKDSANSLNAVGTDIYKNRTLFSTADGKYDTDAILEEIGDFIEKYNDLLIKSENSKAEGIASAITALKSITSDYADKLEKIGITVDKEDNTLSLDEEVFKASKMYNAESLFNGTGSYAYKIAVKAAMVANQAETEANKANTYTGNAIYSNNYNTGSILNDIV